ncbi:ScaI family restriction endonuclease [Crocosphaera sp. XPORK-15E]|uniref:ScaI family restriction endonuclease n=1 Tax=Crocosphaera sp. XPORK-15E TaxID=3110247 RepID=UPI002B1F4EFE|nr:ScaI family restriction endonuclease [Crocosphaera sp. XPORK-15E]MEA5536141.1 ScaI family restriction endonuclease [Crocosphaera sp. XPORK-15E]
MFTSPYEGYPEQEWLGITQQLVNDFPLSNEVLISIVESAWEDIYSSSLGSSQLKIGQDIFLPAQATGVILEKLIAMILVNQYDGWRGSQAKHEKDIVCSFNDRYSFEIKTSSSKSGLYGNRSTGHRSDNRLKYRTGYYLVINYKLPTEDDLNRQIWKIRFGWIDDEDWLGQKKPTGQQASIGAKLASLKLITLKHYP